jgi:hypothetical protein
MLDQIQLLQTHQRILGESKGTTQQDPDTSKYDTISIQESSKHTATLFF